MVEEISCNCDNEVNLSELESSSFRLVDFKKPLISVAFLIVASLISSQLSSEYTQWIVLPLLAVSYLLVGVDVLKKAFHLLTKGDFFNEFMLMSIATLGAFYIGEYIEGVFVMLFYSTGEIIQGNAVKSVRNSIKDLLELQVRNATRIVDGSHQEVKPEEVNPGDHILVKPGEMIALDGVVIEGTIQLNTANITGESLTRVFKKGDELLAGMVCIEKPFTYEVTSNWDHSHINKILHIVEEASNKKAKTQRLISRLSKKYTPIVFFLAVALVVLPIFIDANYSFDKWLYRGLIFLVISCPCAFLIAIPLSYFGGIGLGAHKGILFKGGEVIEKMANLKAIIFDKTGTLTHGKFTLHDIDISENKENTLSKLYALELHSNHPLAYAIKKELKQYASSLIPENIIEYPGFGIECEYDGEKFMAGNRDWLSSKGVLINSPNDELPSVHISQGSNYLGKISFTDQLKENAKETISELRSMKVSYLAMLSGDRKLVVENVGNELNLDDVKGELLPEEKVNEFLAIRNNYPASAFVGDGVNDAPVLAVADVGIAIGAGSSDAAIQSADLVLESDNLENIPTAILIAQKTQRNVWQNLLFAILVKIIVLTLGAFGIAGLWEAIFADVGVALLVILNAYRLKYYS